MKNLFQPLLLLIRAKPSARDFVESSLQGRLLRHD
jgi:hypothetical protein